MLCDECKKNEAVYRTVNKYNGKRTEVNLCADCRRAKLHGERNVKKSTSPLISERKPEIKICTSCGTTLAEFEKSGYVGCEFCYSAFGKEIDERLPKMRQGSSHVGKSPSKEASTPEREYERVNAELRKAVAAEDYDRATQLTARLKELRNNF